MSFELTGVISDIMPVQTFAKGFRKREFVIRTEDKFPQKILFSLVQEKCDMLDSYGTGDTVTVSFEVKGREWSDNSGTVKYFNSLEAWRLLGEKRAPVTKTQQSDDDILNELFPDNTGKSTKLKDELGEPVEPGVPEDDLPF
jgi:hypothetical protein